MNQYVGVYNQSGDTLSTIKYHDGFMGQRIGAICSLAFHPYRVSIGQLKSGPEVIKQFSCSTQLCMIFF